MQYMRSLGKELKKEHFLSSYWILDIMSKKTNILHDRTLALHPQKLSPQKCGQTTHGPGDS